MGITVTVQPAVPATYDFALEQNYPNPFRSPTIIRYSVGKSTRVSIKVYSVLGQEVATLADDHREPGRYTVQWEGRDDRGIAVPAGVYLYRMVAGHYVRSRKLVIE